MLLGEADIKDAIIKTKTGIDVLAANDDLAGAQIEILELPDREVRLKAILMQVENNYDYILIDCPPSLNILTINALASAKSVLIPIQCEYYALEGLSALMSTIDKIKYSLNPGLRIEGLLRTMYDGRNTLSIEVSEQLTEHFPGKVYKTFIPRNVRVAEAPGYGVSVIEYDKASKGATAYLNLAGEFLIRQNQLDEDEVDDTEEDESAVEIEEQPDFTSALTTSAATQPVSNEAQAERNTEPEKDEAPADTQSHHTQQQKDTDDIVQPSEPQTMDTENVAAQEHVQPVAKPVDYPQEQTTQYNQNQTDSEQQSAEVKDLDNESDQKTPSESPERQDESKPQTNQSL